MLETNIENYVGVQLYRYYIMGRSYTVKRTYQNLGSERNLSIGD